jgi:hypothetical protein
MTFYQVINIDDLVVSGRLAVSYPSLLIPFALFHNVRGNDFSNIPVGFPAPVYVEDRPGHVGRIITG